MSVMKFHSCLICRTAPCWIGLKEIVRFDFSWVNGKDDYSY